MCYSVSARCGEAVRSSYTASRAVTNATQKAQEQYQKSLFYIKNP